MIIRSLEGSLLSVATKDQMYLIGNYLNKGILNTYLPKLLGSEFDQLKQPMLVEDCLDHSRYTIFLIRNSLETKVEILRIL